MLFHSMILPTVGRWSYGVSSYYHYIDFLHHIHQIKFQSCFIQTICLQCEDGHLLCQHCKKNPDVKVGNTLWKCKFLYGTANQGFMVTNQFFMSKFPKSDKVKTILKIQCCLSLLKMVINLQLNFYPQLGLTQVF